MAMEWSTRLSPKKSHSCDSFMFWVLRCASWCALDIISLHLGKATIRVGLVLFAFRETTPLGPSAGGSSSLHVQLLEDPVPCQPQPSPVRRRWPLRQHALTGCLRSSPTLSDSPPRSSTARGVSPGYRVFTSSAQWKHWQAFPPLFIFKYSSTPCVYCRIRPMCPSWCSKAQSLWHLAVYVCVF